MMSTTANNTILLYGTSWCSDCRRARIVLKKHGIQFTEIDIDQDAAARAYVESVNDGNRSVPTIVFPDGDILVEPRDSTLAAKLAGLGS